jgi:hypothetical protein
LLPLLQSAFGGENLFLYRFHFWNIHGFVKRKIGFFKEFSDKLSGYLFRTMINFPCNFHILFELKIRENEGENSYALIPEYFQ